MLLNRHAALPVLLLSLVASASCDSAAESALAALGTGLDGVALDTSVGSDAAASDAEPGDVEVMPDTAPTPDTSLDIAPGADCGEGATLAWDEPVPQQARFGSVFSTTLYQQDVVTSHRPEPVRVTLTRNGEPLIGCSVTWLAVGAASFVFPIDERTDANGEAEAWWVAGDVEAPALRASVNGASSIEIEGIAAPSERTRTNSMHMSYDTGGTYDEIKVRVTPLTGPGTTYYSTLNWPGAYTGIQFVNEPAEDVLCGGHRAETCAECPDGNGAAWCNGECEWVADTCVPGPTSGVIETRVLFSVWDTSEDAGNAELIDVGATNVQTGFGGEGTGTSARMMLPPSVYGAIPGLPDDYTLQVDHTYETHLVVSFPEACESCTDYTVYFSDLTRELGPISLGTQRYADRVAPWYASSFVEDWVDAPGDHCMNTGTRTAYFHDIELRRDGDWQTLTTATASAIYRPDNHEICSNYGYGADERGFWLSAGGAERVSPPLHLGGAAVRLP